MSGEIAVAGLGAGIAGELPQSRPALDLLRDRSGRRTPGARHVVVHVSVGLRIAVRGRHRRCAPVAAVTANPGQFRIIVLDTFSSDAIPVHLLTREALSLYCLEARARRRHRGPRLQHARVGGCRHRAPRAGCRAWSRCRSPSRPAPARSRSASSRQNGWSSHASAKISVRWSTIRDGSFQSSHRPHRFGPTTSPTSLAF